MDIRLAKINELDSILKIYDEAIAFTRAHGNNKQWVNGYPSRELLTQDIKDKHLYVVTTEKEIVAVFSYVIGIDSTYIEIDGKWLNDEEYGVVHRIASNGKEKGIAHLVFDWALNKCPNLRIDTHEVNIPMRTLLIKEGFKECGIITIADGTLRIAYHKVI